MAAAAAEDGFRVYIPPPARCTDNAAMIAAAGYYRLAGASAPICRSGAIANLPLPRRARSMVRTT
jgi:N6-L-threonylcarbamoyladenine synthase